MEDYSEVKIEMPEDIRFFCRKHKISKKEIEDKIEVELIEKEYELGKRHKKGLPKKLHVFINFVKDSKSGHKILYPEKNFKSKIMKSTVIGRYWLGFVVMKG